MSLGYSLIIAGAVALGIAGLPGRAFGQIVSSHE
jgi:hypothetical protein